MSFGNLLNLSKFFQKVNIQEGEGMHEYGTRKRYGKVECKALFGMASPSASEAVQSRLRPNGVK